MRIADVRAYALSSPIEPPQTRQFHGGVRTLHKRDSILVVVDTADGERGYATVGASSSAIREHFNDESKTTTSDLIDGPVSEALAGHDVEPIAEAHDVIFDLGLPEPLQSEVIAGIDTALHDIRGKQLGAPIYELLGDDADLTPELTLYASAGMYMQPEGYVRQASTLADLGFYGYKYRPGIGPDGDKRTIERLHETLGADLEFMVDAHTWWKLEDAYDDRSIDHLISAYEEADVFWLEEPVAPDNYDGYRRLNEETQIPLAGGESELTPNGLVRLARTDAVSFLQGDVRNHRGFTGCWEAIEYCARRPVQFVPHNFGTLVGLVANAHLVAAAPDAELLEYPVFADDPVLAHAEHDPGMYPFPLAFDIIEGQLSIEDGTLRLPDKPGLGISVNEAVIEEYPYVDGAWTTFDYEEITT